MNDFEKEPIKNEDMLKGVSGGAGGLGYGMENDPLYQKFTSFWNNGNDGKALQSDMGSRAEFMNAFKQWVKDGVPENISGWYRKYKDR